jgi:hypothetical protein
MTVSVFTASRNSTGLALPSSIDDSRQPFSIHLIDSSKRIACF